MFTVPVLRYMKTYDISEEQLAMVAVVQREWASKSPRATFKEAGISHKDVDHLMIYDAFAHLPLYGLEDLGFYRPGEAAAANSR